MLVAARAVTRYRCHMVYAAHAATDQDSTVDMGNQLADGSHPSDEAVTSIYVLNVHSNVHSPGCSSNASSEHHHLGVCARVLPSSCDVLCTCTVHVLSTDRD